MTDFILKQKPKNLIIIEKDNYLAKMLERRYSQFKNLTVINADILQLDLEEKDKTEKYYFGNLPYNISSQILVNFY